jgi:hypothetical protein
VANGVELVIEPTRAGLSPEQLRQFVRAVMQAYAELDPDNTNRTEK